MQDSPLKGYFKYKGYPWEMYFDEFDLGDGQISARGRDKIGAFTLEGTFNVKGNSVKLVKHYVVQEQDVEYTGQLVRSRNRKSEQILKIQGKWHINDETDDFLIEMNTHSTQLSLILQTISLQKTQFHFSSKDLDQTLAIQTASNFVLNPRN